MHGEDIFSRKEPVTKDGRVPTPFEFIQVIKNDPELAEDFWYCNRKGDAYDFELVSFKDKNDLEYLTISARGVTHIVKGEALFLTLAEWEREYSLYQKLKNIRFFKQYKTWKNFTRWKKLRRDNMIKERSDFLSKELFILDDKLRESLLSVRRQSFIITRWELVDMKFDTIRTIEEFNRDQDAKRENLAGQLEELEAKIKSIVALSCQESLNSFRRDKNTSLQDDENPKDPGEEANPFLVGDGSRMKMTHTQDAILRTHHKRLVKFIRLCDYQLVDAKISLSMQSTRKVLSAITHDYNKKDTRTQRRQTQPLFVIKSDFEQMTVLFTPDAKVVRGSVEDAITRGIAVVCNNEMLLSATEFKKYMESLEEYEDRHFEEEIDLLQMVINDDEFKALEENMNHGIDGVYQRIYDNSKVYLPFLEIFNENEKLTADDFRNCDIEEFKQAIDKFSSQSEKFNEMKPIVDIGIVQVNAETIKSRLKPSPIRCRKLLEELIPGLSYTKSNELIKDLKEANMKLSGAPLNVDEYISQSNYLKQIEDRINDFTSRFSEIKDLNQVVEICFNKYPEPNKAKFNESLQELNTLRQRVQNSAERGESDKVRFTKELREKISAVEKRSKDLMEKLIEPILADKEAPPERVVAYLKDIGEEMEELFQDTRTFNKYQDDLEMERSDFEKVREIRDEFKLKNDLWGALHEWNQKIPVWINTQFSQIDVQGIGADVERYYKIAQRSKALEENGNFVSEVLRTKVDSLRNTMPVVISLRDKSLQQRHWDNIKQVLNREINIQDPEFTLNSLIVMKVNDFKDEIGEIALKANKEAELEKQLKLTLEPWHGQEFVIVSHRNAKDVYILSELDDVIQLLDDTNVQLTTIISNRYIGPLYDQVEPWQKNFARLAEIIDEWINVQKQWIYLENIFNNPEMGKQVPNEYKKFMAVDLSFKELMTYCNDRPGVLNLLNEKKNLLKNLKEWNAKIESVQRGLEEFLNKKRKLFPRFFFLAGDELTEIIAKAKTPPDVSPVLRKFFEAIYELTCTVDEISGIKSQEKESLEIERFKCRGPLEDWLNMLEERMVKALKKKMTEGYQDYDNMPRPEWVTTHLSQVVATVGNIMWTAGTEEALSNREGAVEAIADWYDTLVGQLEELTQLVRSDLDNIQRRNISALVTQDVHNRDIIEKLKDDEVTSPNEFKWLQQLRFYLLADNEVMVRQISSTLSYGYEYLGATTRLVITPLTDRCWITITGALHIKLGAAPAGPAGTGKTESTKDLAKGLARYCVVFNCSDQISHKTMEQLFMGLCFTGAWSCLDEFNRIDIEVLSVIAQQLRYITNAKLANAEDFYLDDKQCRLMPSMGVFITMNPGYAGRAELPDNLKVLFRPVSMMVPDYTLIAEIMLFAEGFSEASRLSGKMSELYKLCSEQLSKQDHYDFGMRAVKSVLVMAGALKRKDPDLSEDAVLIRAMRDSNVPKFLKDDLVLFYAIISDLFPEVEAPYTDYGELQQSIIEVVEADRLEPLPTFVDKVIQLFETFAVRFGVMIVGPATSGKSACYIALAKAMTTLRRDKRSKNDAYQEVEYKYFNPKCISIGELYGDYDERTSDWKDGLASNIMRNYAEREDNKRKWVVLDGPVDAIWIENMNTVLDDNMMLCLANGQRIKLRNEMRMLFEVQDLSKASPATVSRCGMVYMNIEAVGWRPYISQWLAKETDHLSGESQQYIKNLTEIYIDKALTYLRKNLNEPIPTVDNSLVMSLCSLLKALLHPDSCKRLADEFDQLKKYIDKIFMFAMVWSIGGAVDSAGAYKFDNWLTNEFSGELPKGSLYESYVADDKMTGYFKTWDSIKEDFVFDPSMSYFELVVPTKDTVRFSYLLKKQISVQKPVFITGYTGVGKSVIITDTLMKLKETDNKFPVFLTFSAQTSSLQTQNSILAKLDSKRKDMYGGPAGRKVLLLIDDVNMPAVEEYGAQPPIELMRQYCDVGYVYDRVKHFPIKIVDTTLICCAAPPEGGRNPLTMRFTRHFHMLFVPPTSEDSMMLIFKTIIDGFLLTFKPEVQSLSSAVVQATVNTYNTILNELLPTPSKSHYTFNLRDISKVFQGILMSSSRSISEADSMIRLWIHETSRVFHDRLINNEDKTWFQGLIVKQIASVFRKDWSMEDIYGPGPILFGDFMKGSGADDEDRIYDEIKDGKKLVVVMTRYLEDYNDYSAVTMQLVFFEDALEHICRTCRILRQLRGNAMLVGVGGSGKQSLTRLSAFICKCEVFQVSVAKNYGQAAFREDLKKLFIMAGGPEARPTVFLLTDTQIIHESFLEDVNNILNSGEVSNLFPKEEQDTLEQDLRPVMDQRLKENPARAWDSLYAFFIDQVRSNLHVVLCMSPVGDSLRVRMRMFPSLVNCTTIDWVNPWPEQALLSVSSSKLKDLPLDNLKKDDAVVMRDNISRMCMEVHKSVIEMSADFLAALNRKVYITPKSYLDMIACYYSLLEEKREQLTFFRDRYRKGVFQLEKTNEDVASMQIELTRMRPILEKKKELSEQLNAKMAIDAVEANKIKEVVEAEEAEITTQTEEIKVVQAQSQAALDEAMPALKEAESAVSNINSGHIAEIKGFSAPHELIKFTLECVSILLQEKPDWDSVKRTMQNDFINRLLKFERDDIPKPVLRKVRQKMASNPNFNPDEVGRKNVASKSLCIWVFAIDKYAKISEEVEPIRRNAERLTGELNSAQARLAAKRAELQKELDKVAELQAQKDAAQAETDRLNKEVETTNMRLERSSVLTEGLRDENERWKKAVESLNEQLINLLGDAFLSAACISYYGPFTGIYRRLLVSKWLEKCVELNIPVSPGFDLREVLGDPMKIREWNIQGLPSDDVSVCNGILVTRSSRWPLMIDPQEQASKWIRRLEEKRQIKVTKQTDTHLGRVVENCIRNGIPLLLEDVGEIIDPSLDPLLQKNLVQQAAGVYALRVGDQEIDYDMNFRLYLTSKISNPHYLPEITIKVTIINFTVTVQGLQEQLLADVVKIEKPQIEKENIQLITSMSEDQKRLKAIEEKILQSLSENKTNILDNAQLIEDLKNSKRVSSEINKRMEQAKLTKQQIEEVRGKYFPVAVRGSILYFVIADLALIDPMYQYSLSYFTRLFNEIIKNSRQSQNLDERILILTTSITETIYSNVCRGLFNSHKLIFSFLITVQICRERDEVKDVEWSLLLKGVALIPADFRKTANPDPAAFNEKSWEVAVYLQNTSEPFKEPLLCEHIKANKAAWKAWVTCKKPEEEPLPAPFDGLDSFHKMLLIKAFRQEKIIYSVIQFVAAQLGNKFVQVPPISMEEVYAETNCKSPVIFILSQGADPMSLMTRLAEDKDFTSRIENISLGKGQGEKAKSLVEKSLKSGKWVILQNCHLFKSWMSELELLVEHFADAKTQVHEDFRLFLTSMPVSYFPVPVLQMGVKITNEPPKGIKTNVLRSLNNLSDEMLNDSYRPEEWKKLVFSLAFFHAIVQERRKFGPLGWNIRYEFNESDLETSLTTLKLFLDDRSQIPWEAISFVTGEINYGGRVTDEWDRRCLMNILGVFMTVDALGVKYKFSESGRYYIPEDLTLQSLKDYVGTLPISDEPEVFGMHENANITFQSQESELILTTALSIQPRESGKGSMGKTPDQLVDELAASILESLPMLLLRTSAGSTTFMADSNGLMESMATFLLQEMSRFNNLLKVMRQSLNDLRKAIKGIVVMSAVLDKMYTRMLNNQVPLNWEAVAYPSLKPLASWITDMHMRVAFLRKWLEHGKPEAYWLNAFFFPQGFLTAVQQSFSRKYKIAIDILKFSFEFQTFFDVTQVEAVPEDGCLVYGLYMEGCRWDADSMILQDPFPGEKYSQAPLILFVPNESYTTDPDDYGMPLYKTSVRAGVLSTTGHSTNFVMRIDSPTSKKPSYWVLQGAALLCQLND
jgi:dynein heavy chain